jgi:hypothetical protein
MGYFNLEDNMFVQVLSAFVQFAIVAQWIVIFFERGFDGANVPAFGSGKAQGTVLGQVVLNYAYVMTVPSWINEKKPSSNVNRCVWGSVWFSTGTFFIVMIMGALSFPNLQGADILTAIDQASGGSVADQIGVYLFPLIAVASSIPVFSIIIRYNLMENNVCGKVWANIWAVVLPWVLAIPLTAGNTIFNDVATYTSILFVLPVNFIIPFLVYIMAMRRKAYLKPCLCEPGPCQHDGEGGMDSSINTSYHAVSSGGEMESDKHVKFQDVLSQSGHIVGDVVHEHKFVLRQSGPGVKLVDRVKKRELWSEKNPKMAKCCCASWVRWKDKPPVSPMAPFSLRHKYLAKITPKKLLAWLDKPSPVANEHFALPTSFHVYLKQAIGLVILMICVIFLLFSLGLQVWNTIDPLVRPGLNMTGNGTQLPPTNASAYFQNNKDL